jgi:polysaccharide deacetylase family protein (PEP-CTERM system associated)
METKYFFLTLDLEEWYHLDYFKNFSLTKSTEFITELDEFFSFLEKQDINITVFVLAELAEKYPELVKRIAERGHEIACHGLDHDLLTNKTGEEFESQIIKAKSILESITNHPVIGYRASCFSMDREKLEILRKIGFKYDSSFIRFAQHSLYNELDMSGFSEIDNLVYENNGFYEFELPTQKVKHMQLPVSGGGYFRIFPTIVYERLFNRFKKNNKNFNFYIHPFEVVEKKFVPEGIPTKEKLRYNMGRRNNLKRFERFISKQKRNYQFSTIQNYLGNLN